jgi:hypothetical protein
MGSDLLKDSLVRLRFHASARCKRAKPQALIDDRRWGEQSSIKLPELVDHSLLPECIGE